MITTRREFLHKIAAVGGYSATFLTMQALGMTPATAATLPLTLEKGKQHGTRVVILGAGVAGLSAAYELGKAGYDCVVLEARERSGGRNWTIRGGDKLEMTDGTVQTCGFDRRPNLYWNAGPARLPARHETILGYVREFGIPLEVEVNTTREAYMFNADANGGKRVQMSQAMNDTRGAVSELLAKAIDRGALDQELTAHDKERVFAFLKQYGDLTPEKLYKGSTRAGFKTHPTADHAGTGRDPLPLNLLLDMDLWNGVIFEDIIDQQATMFQPVGGMDAIPKAFEKRLGKVIRFNSPVTALRRKGNGVQVAYLDKKSGQTRTVDAAYCLNTMALPILAKIPADFSPAHAEAIKAVHYHESVKVAWQAPRFWEKDDNLYGGISWIKGPTNMIWYPSGGMLEDLGVLVSAYASGAGGDIMSSKSLAEQFEWTRKVVEGAHPGKSAQLGKPMAIAWKKVPHSLGAAPEYHAGQENVFATLCQPDGPFYFGGDAVSRIGNWQEATIAGTRRALNLIEAHRMATSASAAKAAA
jgi:monoamine oxidase